MDILARAGTRGHWGEWSLQRRARTLTARLVHPTAYGCTAALDLNHERGSTVLSAVQAYKTWQGATLEAWALHEREHAPPSCSSCPATQVGCVRNGSRVPAHRRRASLAERDPATLSLRFLFSNCGTRSDGTARHRNASGVRARVRVLARARLVLACVRCAKGSGGKEACMAIDVPLRTRTPRVPLPRALANTPQQAGSCTACAAHPQPHGISASITDSSIVRTGQGRNHLSQT